MITTPITSLTNNRTARVGCVFAVCLSLIPLQGCSEVQSQATETPPVTQVPVHVESVAQGDINAAYGSTAVLEAAQEAEVLARQAGVVTQLFVEEGDSVEAGQILAQLETDQLELELARAQANLKRLANDLRRQERIHAQNLVSAEEYDRIKFEYEAQKAQTALARLNLEHATLRAPIAGIVANRYIKQGNMLRENERAFHITDMSTLHAVIHLPESEKAELRPQQVAHLKVAASENAFVGRIERVSPIVDRDTGTIRVTVTVDALDTVLRPGMFSRVGIIYDQHEDTLLIPKAAVVTEDNAAYVFTYVNGKANKQSITMGFVDNDMIEVLSGLNLGDQVITMGQRNIRDQADVEIIEAVATL